MDNKDVSSFLLERFSNIPKIERLEGGGNNQVYRVTFLNSSLILKKYFFDQKDRRNRLFHEYAFLKHAEKLGVSNTALAIDFCPKRRIGLYSDLPGRRATILDIKKESIEQFISFFRSINQDKNNPRIFPRASDSSLSIFDHFTHLESRFGSLLKMDSREVIDKEVLFFIKNKLQPFYKQVKDKIVQKIGNLGVHKSIKNEELCLSPSDFGFHNVLIKNEKLFFYDFEYAGLDDPVNLLANFFSQPKNPISQKYFTKVSWAFFSFLSNPESAFKRFAVSYPLCQIKWCLLSLNSFQAVGARRRAFAACSEKKVLQFEQSKSFLKKAEEALDM